MHHDFFAWVRLLLFIILFLFFALILSAAEPSQQMERPEPTEPIRKEPIYIAQVTAPTGSETAPEQTFINPPTETTTETKPATTAAEPTAAPTEETEPPTQPAEVWSSLGTYTLTAYCSCQTCCGQYALNRPLDESGNPIVYTSIGAIAKAGVTIAVDPRVIPYGSEVKINDHVYIAQDTGGAITGARIDIYFDDHQKALEFGLQTAEVFIRS